MWMLQSMMFLGFSSESTLRIVNCKFCSSLLTIFSSSFFILHSGLLRTSENVDQPERVIFCSPFKVTVWNLDVKGASTDNLSSVNSQSSRTRIFSWYFPWSVKREVTFYIFFKPGICNFILCLTKLKRLSSSSSRIEKI